MFHYFSPLLRAIALISTMVLMLGITSPVYAWEPDAEYYAQWGLSMLHADEAYKLGFTGQGVTIGVIDTGMQFTHQEFSDPNKQYGFNFYSLDNPEILDANGHGSHVAGIIGAKKDGIGMYGVAYNSSLVSAPYLSSSSPGDIPVSAYINYLLNGENTNFPHPPVSIINNSWSSVYSATKETIPITDVTKANLETDSYYKDMVDCYKNAVASGMLVVFTAGNSSLSESSVQGGLPFYYPELTAGWLNVVALDSSQGLAPYSNKAGLAKEWTIAAPGGGNHVPTDDYAHYPAGVYYPDGIYSVGSGNTKELFGDGKGYAAISGTSMAAPHVSGAAALVWEAFPNFTAAQVGQTLLLTATDLGELGIDDIYGWGLLDVGKAVRGVQVGDLPNYLPNHYVILVPLSGNGGLTITGGRFLTLTGNNTYTDPTSVQNGSTLIINGSLNSRVDVDSSSTLGGSGVINNSVNLSGTVSSGNSPGTLTVTGDFNQLNGSTYLAELAGTNLNQYDRIIVGGQYLCGLNVTLIPQLSGGYQPKIGDGYTIVDATGGSRTGSYTTIDQSNSLAGMQFDVLYGQDKINLYSTPSNYNSVSNLGWQWNYNQAQVAKTWEKDRPTPGVLLNDNQRELYTALFPLNTAGLQQAASQMSGQLIADTQAGALDQLRNLNHTVGKMVVEGETVKLFNNSMNVDSGTVSGRSLRSGGAVVNYELGKKDNQRWGLGVGYSSGKVKSDSGPGSATVESYGLHYYNYQQPTDWYIQTQIGFGQTQQRHDREIGQANVSGKTNGEHFFGRLAIGKEESKEDAKYGLEAALLWESVKRKSMTETGNNAYTVSSASTQDQRLASEIALTGRQILESKPGRTTTLDTKLGWIHDFQGLDNQVDLKWRGENMNIKSEKLGADAIQYGLGVNWQWEKGCQFKLSALGEHRSNSNRFNLEAAMNYTW